MDIKKIFQTRKGLESRILRLEQEIEILKDQNRRLYFSVDILLAASLDHNEDSGSDLSPKAHMKVA